jgi:hypothetical protein
MSDPMLSELYKRVFETKARAEALSRSKDKDEFTDRLRQVAIAKNELLLELISIRTDQIRNGRDNKS